MDRGAWRIPRRPRRVVQRPLRVDLDQDLFKMWIDGEEVFQAAYNGNFSSINFYALGDGETIGLYYIDSITLAESDVDLVNVEEAAAQAFGFHPNPSNGQLRLSGIQTQTTLVVLDLMGREVLSESLDAGQQSVQLDLPEGVYLIELTTKEPAEARHPLSRILTSAARLPPAQGRCDPVWRQAEDPSVLMPRRCARPVQQDEVSSPHADSRSAWSTVTAASSRLWATSIRPG